jgi:hypothetical protein
LFAIAYEYYDKLIIMEITNLSIRNPFPGIGMSKKAGDQIPLSEF